MHPYNRGSATPSLPRLFRSTLATSGIMIICIGLRSLREDFVEEFPADDADILRAEGACKLQLTRKKQPPGSSTGPGGLDWK